MAIVQKKHWALGALVEEALGMLPVDVAGGRENDVRYTYTRALGNWYRLVYAFTTKESVKAIEDLMSVWHKTSLSLLYDWWTAAYQEPACSLQSILDIIDHCNDLSPSVAPDEWSTLLHKLRLRDWPSGDLKEPDDSTGVSRRYDLAMRWLFQCEFGFAGGYNPMRETDKEFITRRNARQGAARLAYCQKLGWKLFHDWLPANPLAKQEERLDVKDDDFGLLQDDLLLKGPSLEPCPWLSDQQDQQDQHNRLPHFLWDVATAHTVQTSSLGSTPTYTAISHTWGRWIKGKPINVPGVPWKVPQNERFVVERLPHLLAQVPIDTRYVWLDLVCIPQQGDPLLKALEIGRQARIFREAQNVVAWLNDVDDFDGLRYITSWMALRLLQLQDQTYAGRYQQMVAEIWSQIPGTISNLMEPRGQESFWQNTKLNSWFTSLWTLQELALRPDMCMCTRDWTYFTSDGHTPMSIGALVAVLETFHREDWEPTLEGIMPSLKAGNNDYIGVFELWHWRFFSGLDKLLELDQVGILALGDRRYCTERRAEAIMSALGVTNWYNEALHDAQSDEITDYLVSLEKDLVLNKYPVQFVNELCQQCPGEFFGAFMRVTIDTNAASTRIEPPGTMLPFNNVPSYCASVSGFRTTRIHSTAHESVSTWRVLSTGQVHMPKACVIGSSSYSQTTNILPVVPAGLTSTVRDENAPYLKDFKSKWDDSIDYTRFFDLHLWIRQQRHETFAVLIEYTFSIAVAGVSDRTLQGAGLVLERTPSGALVKRDHFVISDDHNAVDLGAVQQVDWLVD